MPNRYFNQTLQNFYFSNCATLLWFDILFWDILSSTEVLSFCKFKVEMVIEETKRNRLNDFSLYM